MAHAAREPNQTQHDDDDDNAVECVFIPFLLYKSDGYILYICLDTARVFRNERERTKQTNERSERNKKKRWKVWFVGPFFMLLKI